MVTVEQVKNGLTKYVDGEILPNMTGAKKFALGVYMALAAENIGGIIMKYKDNPAIAALNVVDGNGNIDIDRLRTAAMSVMRNSGKVSFDIPMLGVLTMNEDDIDALYEYITEA